MPHKVLIKDKVTAEWVTATLVDDVGPAELEAAEAFWRPVREAAVSRLRRRGLTDPQIAVRIGSDASRCLPTAQFQLSL